MKKFLSVLTLFAIILSITSDSLITTNAESYMGFEYTHASSYYDDSFIIINGYTGNETNIVIPAEIDGIAVKIIGVSAFEDNTKIKSVTLPESLETIETCAFNNCTSLAEINLPDGIVLSGNVFDGTAYDNDESNWTDGILYLGNYLLDTKENLSGNKIIKPGTKSVCGGAFAYQSNITGITIPNSVEFLGGFSYCDGLTEVTIPNGVITIDILAFAHCTNLKRVSIPNSIEYIGTEAFDGCTNLSEFSLPDKKIKLGSFLLDDTAYYLDYRNWEDSALYAGNHLITLTSDKLYGDYEIKPGTLTIAEQAFMNQYFITSITCPESLLYIGIDAFTGCSDVQTISVTGRKTYIEPSVFQTAGQILFYGQMDSPAQNYAENDMQMIFADINSKGFEFSEIDDKNIQITKYIGDDKNVTVPKTINKIPVTSIAKGAFQIYVKQIESITIPDTVTEIESGAFTSRGFTIRAKANSAAHLYASENEISFREIGMKGDVDNNGEVNATDATLVLQYFSKIITDDNSKFDSEVADVDKSTEINATDATLILQYFSKIIQNF